MTERAVDVAKKALKALGKEDLLFTHHGEVMARPEAYARLAEFFEDYAKSRNEYDDIREQPQKE